MSNINTRNDYKTFENGNLIFQKSTKAKELSFAEFIDLLKHIDLLPPEPTKNIRAERLKFWNRKITKDENLESFIASINELAENCSFGAMKEEILADKLIASLKDKFVQDQLVHEPMTKSYLEICEEALDQEKSEKENLGNWEEYWMK